MSGGLRLAVVLLIGLASARPSCHENLGVARGERDEKTLKKAYRKMALNSGTLKSQFLTFLVKK